MRRLKIYEENPNATEIGKAVEVLREGGIVIYPTDTIYALGCDALNVRAVERICRIKGINPQKVNLSIICRELSWVSEYAKLNNLYFKLLKPQAGGGAYSRPCHYVGVGRGVGQSVIDDVGVC